MYQNVIFDLDGTLLDSLQDLANASNYICKQNGWNCHSLEEYRYFVGNGIPKLCERFSPPEFRQEPTLSKTVAEFQAYYALHKQDCTKPYPGIVEMLERCLTVGITIGVLTNKENTVAQSIVQHYFPDIFPFVQGALPNIPTKPNPEGLRHLMARMGASLSNTLFVGDSNVDIFTANNGGLDSCGVLWGFRTQEELQQAGCTYIASNAQELWDVITQKAF